MDDRATTARPLCEALEPRLLLAGGITDLRIDGETVAWSASDGHDYQIYRYDSAGVRQLTDNDTDDIAPHISGDLIVWQSWDGTDWEIYLYDGSTTRRLTNTTRNDHSPQTDGNAVVWLSNDGRHDSVMLYDIAADSVQQLTPASQHAKYLRIAGGNVTWYAHDGMDYEIFLYDGAAVRRVTNNTIDDMTPHVSRTHVVWRAFDGHDNEIFLYDITADAITQITDNDYNDAYPGLTDTSVIWAGRIDGHYQVFVYDIDSGVTAQITHNDGHTFSPRTDPGGAVWIDGVTGQVWRYDCGSGAAWQLTNDGAIHALPAASGDGVVWRSGDRITKLDTTGESALVQFTNFGVVAEPLITIDDLTIPEGHGPTLQAVTARLSAPAAHPVTVQYATADGAALAGKDYVATEGLLTFLPGDVARTIPIMVLGNLLIEPDKDFTVTLSRPVGGISGTTSATVTLLDDDTPGVSVADAEVIEGDPAGALAFVIRLCRPIVLSVTVHYTTVDGTAVAAEGDYAETSGSITFLPGEPVVQTVKVPVFDDDEIEPHETLLFRLTDATNARITRAEAVGTILNDDTEIAFDEASLWLSLDEGPAGTSTTFEFVLRLAQPSALPVTVEWTTAPHPDATAHATPDADGERHDYAPASGIITFEPGQTEATITVIVHGDDDIEPDETFAVVLNNPTGATIATPMAVGEILDDDAPRLSVKDVSVIEGDPFLTIYDITRVRNDEGLMDFVFTVSLSQVLAEPLEVAFRVEGGTAIADEDFLVPGDSALTFAPGQTKATIAVPVVGGTQAGPAATFTVSLGQVTGPAVVSRGVATGRILSNVIAGGGLRIWAYDVAMCEGDTGITHLPVVVRLSHAAATPVTVEYEVRDGTAIADLDYIRPAPGVLRFEPGEVEKIIQIPVFGNETVQGDRHLTVHLSNPTAGASLGKATARATIIDDNTEGAFLEFTVRLDTPSETGDVTVDYATDDGDAIAGEDYLSVQGALTLAFDDDNASLSRTVRVPIIGNLNPEPDKTFSLLLSNAAHAKIITDSATGTILNDDTWIAFAPDSLEVAGLEGDTGTSTLDFEVVCSHVTASPVSVRYYTVHGTTDDDDFAVVAPPGNLLTLTPDNDGLYRGTISVTVFGDTLIETDETFTVVLTDPTGGTLGEMSTATGIILDDDTPIATVADAAVVEGDSGHTQMEFTVTLSRPNDQQVVTIAYQTADDPDAVHPATADVDYLPASGVLTFPIGTTTQIFQVTVVGDRDVEPDETFAVVLSEPDGAVFADGSDRAVGTILNDDAGISIFDAETLEGTGPYPTRVDVQVVLSQPVAHVVTVEYMTLDGTATMEDNDYIPASGTITFAPGQKMQTVPIYVIADDRVEPDETFYVLLHEARGAELTRDRATVTILDDDMPRLSIADAEVIEGDPSGVMRFTVTLTGGIDTGDIKVHYTTVDGTALAGEDYISTWGVLVFAPGDTAHTIEVPILDDDISEPTEDFQVILSNPVNAIIANGEATGTILNDDGELTIADASTLEGDEGITPLEFTVTLAHPVAVPVTVEVSTEDGTATAGEDYLALDKTLTFEPGATSHIVTVSVLGDLLFEPDETFHVVLSNPTNATIVAGRATGTILNDDPEPRIEIDDIAVIEGDVGTTVLAVPVRLTNASALPVSVRYETIDGTAKAGVDYHQAGGTITFAPQETKATIEVLIFGNTTVEPDKTFTLVLSDPAGATIADGEATVTIRNDDTTIAVHDAAILEGHTGLSYLTFTVTLSAATVFDVTVDYVTADGTAIAGEDYYAVNGTLTFVAGQTTRSISVPVIGDTLTEPDEMFMVSLSNATNAVIDRGVAIGTIINDDADPAISIDDASLLESDGLMEFTLRLSNPSVYPISVRYETADGSATAGEDYVATAGIVFFNPRTVTQTITVRILDDDLIEANETFWVILSDPTNATIGRGYAMGTIIDDDAPAALPMIGIADATLLLSDSGQDVMTFTVTLSAAAGHVVEVRYATIDGTAVAGEHYTPAEGTLILDAGTTGGTVEITILGNLGIAQTATFTVMLSEPIGAALGDGEATGTIESNAVAPVPQAQLAAGLGAITLPTVTVPGDRGRVAVVLTNAGAARAAGTVIVRAYTSSDGMLDADDVLLAESAPRRVAIAPGRSTTLALPVTISTDVPVGPTWYVLAELVVVSGIDAADPVDNLAVDSIARTTQWWFGALPGQNRRVRLNVADAAGTPVTLALGGGGWGEVIDPDSFGGIVLHETTTRSALVVNTARRAPVTVSALTAAGPLARVSAGTLNVVGDVNLGYVGSLWLGDVSGGAITLGPPPTRAAPTAVRLATVSDVSLTSDGPLRSIIATQWLDTNAGPDCIVASSLGVLRTTGLPRGAAQGDFAADLQLTGALGQAIVGGDVTGHWTAAGANAITVRGDLAGATLELTEPGTGRTPALRALTVRGNVIDSAVQTAGAVGRLQVRGDFAADLNLAGAVGQVIVGGDATGHWTAAGANAITVRGDLAGATLELTEPGTGRTPALRALTVRGNVIDSAVQTAGAVGWLQVRGDFAADLNLAGAVGQVIVGGDATGHWTAAGANAITIRGNLAGATLELTEPGTGRTPALRALTVRGGVLGSTVRAAGSIGSLHMQTSESSDFLAGVAAAVSRHPTSAAEFLNPDAAIGRIVIAGRRGSTDRFVTDSNFAAGSLGVVNLLNADFAAGDIGLWARADADRPIRAIRYVDRLTRERWTWPPRPNALFAGPEDLINLLG